MYVYRGKHGRVGIVWCFFFRTLENHAIRAPNRRTFSFSLFRRVMFVHEKEDSSTAASYRFVSFAPYFRGVSQRLCPHISVFRPLLRENYYFFLQNYWVHLKNSLNFDTRYMGEVIVNIIWVWVSPNLWKVYGLIPIGLYSDWNEIHYSFTTFF